MHCEFVARLLACELLELESKPTVAPTPTPDRRRAPRPTEASGCRRPACGMIGRTMRECLTQQAQTAHPIAILANLER